MNARILLYLLLCSISLNGTGPWTLDLGPTWQYTHYDQGNLPSQKGFMAGLAFDTYYQNAWKPMGYVGFRGLWDIPNICSCNGLMIDSNEYNVNAHLGYCFASKEKNLLVSPFTGFDFIYLKHEIEHDIFVSHYAQINIPLGVFLTHRVSENFEWSLRTYYDFAVWTRLNITTPCLCPTECDEVTLKGGKRFYIEVPLRWHFRPNKKIGIDFAYTPLFSWQKFNNNECCLKACNIPTLSQWHLGAVITLGINF